MDRAADPELRHFRGGGAAKEWKQVWTRKIKGKVRIVVWCNTVVHDKRGGLSCQPQSAD